MNIGTITTITKKGQVVIPQKIRKSLGMKLNQPIQIIQRGNGVYISPVDSVITKVDYESSYADLLRKTQGAWAGDDWEKTRKKQRKVELAASKRRKEAW